MIKIIIVFLCSFGKKLCIFYFSFQLINYIFMSQANLYIGLVVMCGFIVYDTQNIMEKRQRGDKDFIMHSVELFIDFVSVFKKLLIIMTNKVKIILSTVKFFMIKQYFLLLIILEGQEFLDIFYFFSMNQNFRLILNLVWPMFLIINVNFSFFLS